MLTRKINLIFLVPTCIFLITSCSKTMMGLYGIKNPKVIDEKAILSYSKMYNIPLEDSYVIDTSYSSFISSLDTTWNKVHFKNHLQPLQALYYNQTGQLQSFQINCYAGGFPNLHWNRDNILTTFPPLQQAPVDNILSLDMQLKYLKPLANTKIISVANYDFIVIIYWNRFMSRQSERLIHFIQDNSKLANGKKVKILYANNDGIFAASGLTTK